jgi:glycerophosphoryl diester phosphodiesterase
MLSFLMPWLPYLAVASLYPVLSFTLLKRPLARFQHRPLPKLNVRTSAHRGGAFEAPENTLAAFAHSATLGIDLFELDVHLTKDKQVVVYHDHTVDRLAPDGVKGFVRDFNYSELPPLDVAAGLRLPPPFHPHTARLHWTPPPNTSPSLGTKPPLLEELFRAHPEQAMNIDCKEDSDELVEQTARLIEKHEREDRTLWGSGKDGNAQRMYRRNPAIPLFFSGKQIALLYLKFLTGVLPFTHIKERAIEIPLFTPALMARMKEHGTVISEGQQGWKGAATRAVFGAYNYLSTSSALIQHLQARNIKVIYWVLNSEEEFAQAFDAGADGIMTDAPGKLMEFVRKRDAASGEARKTR